MKIPHISSQIVTSGNAAALTTTYYALGSGGGWLGDTTESHVETLYRSAGTASGMWLRVANATAGGTKVCTFRKNGAAGNQTFTIPSSGSGIFQDASNTDAIAAGDKIDMQIVNNSSTNQTIGQLGILFQDSNSSNTTNRFVARNVFTTTSASTNYYWPVAGAISTGTSPTEANAQFKNRSPATLKNLCILVSANTFSGSCTLISRKNGGAGNLTITIPANTTGYFEDTTNSDSLVSGDLVNLEFSTGTGSGSITVQMVCADYITTNNQTHYVNASPQANALSQGATGYTGLGGVCVMNSTETQVSSPVYVAGKASNLQAYVAANTIAASSTVNFRASAAAGNNLVTIGSTATGFFEDTTHTDGFTASQNIDLQVIRGASGSNTIQITMMAILVDFTQSSAPATWSPSSSFAVTGASLAKGVASFHPAASLAAHGASQVNSKATFTATGHLAPVGHEIANSVASFSPHAVLAVHGTGLHQAAATFSASAILSASGRSVLNSKLTISAAAVLAVTGHSIFRQAAIFNPAVSFAGHGKSLNPTVATINASSALTAKGNALHPGAATFHASAALSGAGHNLNSQKATFNPASIFTGRGASLNAGAATFHASAILEATGADIDRGRATFTTVAALVATGHSLNSQKATFAPHSAFAARGTSLISSTATFHPSAHFSAVGAEKDKATATFTVVAAFSGVGVMARQGEAEFNPAVSFSAVSFVYPPPARIINPPYQNRVINPPYQNRIINPPYQSRII